MHTEVKQHMRLEKRKNKYLNWFVKERKDCRAQKPDKSAVSDIFVQEDFPSVGVGIFCFLFLLNSIQGNTARIKEMAKEIITCTPWISKNTHLKQKTKKLEITFYGFQ